MRGCIGWLAGIVRAEIAQVLARKAGALEVWTIPAPAAASLPATSQHRPVLIVATVSPLLRLLAIPGLLARP